LWDFGDATSSSTLQNPTHAYQKTGTYTVSLSVNKRGRIEHRDEIDNRNCAGDPDWDIDGPTPVFGGFEPELPIRWRQFS
jgi:hypothetical protein